MHWLNGNVPDLFDGLDIIVLQHHHNCSLNMLFSAKTTAAAITPTYMYCCCNYSYLHVLLLQLLLLTCTAAAITPTTFMSIYLG